MTGIIIDTNVIIDNLENNSLENLFAEISAKKDKIWITPDVHRELQEKLDDEQRIQFEILLKQGIKDSYVEKSLHKFRLKMPCKKLAQDLRMFHVRLQRTDRNLIALKYQIKGEILTNDDGIIQAINQLRTKDTPWRNYILSVEAQSVEDFTEHK